VTLPIELPGSCGPCSWPVWSISGRITGFRQQHDLLTCNTLPCLFLLLHSTMSANFSSTERFRVSMISSDGASERVTVQLSLDGLKILTQDGSRTMRSYNLRNVSSWDLMDTSTVIWTKSDVDLEERALTLSGDSTTIRNVVDTLASCCMQ